MKGARIEDGSILVIEEDEIPSDETVVALRINSEEVTVKRLYREGEMVRLRPENGGHQDLVVAAEDVEIQGRAVYVIHPPSRK